MEIEASIVIDAPRDDVYAILTDYGAPVRLRINPELIVQDVVEHFDNVIICDNEWERRGKVIRQRRRYTLSPPDRIVEESLGARAGMSHVVTTCEEYGVQTILTMRTTYILPGIWRYLGRFAEQKLRQADDELLETLRDGIEAEFEEVANE